MGDEKHAETAEVVKDAVNILEQAKRAVGEAETRLEAALSDIRQAPRAEKTAVSSAIETALTRLRAARREVADAEVALAGEALR